MCSRCRSSLGASRHMISMASWSPRKSEPFTVSYACDSQVSSGLIAALMPPAAATECERTGWTLLMIATVAPLSAAARAARWPARPAPMIRTSWAGMRPGLYKPSGDSGRQGAADLLDGHDPAEHALGVDRHQRAEVGQAGAAEQRLERLVAPDPEALGLLLDQLGRRDGRLAAADRLLDALLAQHPEVAAVRVG